MKLARLAVLLVAVGLVAGCGGSGAKSNGVAEKTADQIVADAQNAIDDATAVHVKGAGTSGGSPLELDLHLVAGKGGAGTLAVGGLRFEIVRIGDRAYFKGDDAFWRQFGGTAAVQLFHGRWLVAPADTGDLSSFTPLTDIEQLFKALLGDHGTLQKGEETTVGTDDAPVIAVVRTSSGGTLYVATTGKPYPLQVEGGKDSPGSITFDEWDKPIELTAPKDAIDFSKLQQ